MMISHLDYFCILSFLRFLSKTKLPLALKISVGEERESTYSKEEWLYRKIAISRFCNPILHLICIISGTQMIHHLNSSATIYIVPRTRSHRILGLSLVCCSELNHSKSHKLSVEHFNSSPHLTCIRQQIFFRNLSNLLGKRIYLLKIRMTV